ncbi:MAG TPA: MFS transporter [Acidimicrobiales bacterium]
MTTTRNESTDMASPHAGARLDRPPPSNWLRGILGLLFLSWFVEAYDIGLTGSVLPSITHQYALGTAMKVFVSISANIGIVIGIFPAGRLADRYGRRRILIIATTAYAVLTFSVGLSSGLGWFIALRILDGMAMGAVFPLPYIFASELCPPTRRGRYTGWADSCLSIGYFLSPLLAIVLIPNVDSTGWRTMFLIGGVPILFAALAWRYLPESPRWLETKGRFAEANVILDEIESKTSAYLGAPLPPFTAKDAPPPVAQRGLGALLRPSMRRRSLTLWATFGGTFFLFYSIQTFMPTVINQMGFTLTSAFAFTAVIVGASIPGKFFEAWVVERWGRRPVIITFTLAAAIAAFTFGFVRGALPVLALGCLMSFFGIGVDPAVKTYTAESYPTEYRAWGTSTTEGIGRLISGVLGPSLVPILLDNFGVGAVFVLVGTVALAAVFVVLRFGHETNGMTLEESSLPTVRPLRMRSNRTVD